MFDPKYDPYQALEELDRNQKILYNNDQEIARSINDLLNRLQQQQEIIDRLVKQVESTNRANEILLETFLKELNKSFKDLKWPNQ
jgi:archaellum component FlaC